MGEEGRSKSMVDKGGRERKDGRAVEGLRDSKKVERRTGLLIPDIYGLRSSTGGGLREIRKW